MTERRERAERATRKKDVGEDDGRDGGKARGKPVKTGAPQPNGIERDRGRDNSCGARTMVDGQEGEHEPARQGQRRDRHASPRNEDGCRRHRERKRERAWFSLTMSDNADHRDAARDNRDGRVEEELMTSPHAPNVARPRAGRVLLQE
jgi:hypothetical protein